MTRLCVLVLLIGCAAEPPDDAPPPPVAHRAMTPQPPAPVLPRLVDVVEAPALEAEADTEPVVIDLSDDVVIVYTTGHHDESDASDDVPDVIDRCPDLPDDADDTDIDGCPDPAPQPPTE